MGTFFKFSKIPKNYFSLFYFFESKRLFFPLFEKCSKGEIFKGEVFGLPLSGNHTMEKISNNQFKSIPFETDKQRRLIGSNTGKSEIGISHVDKTDLKVFRTKLKLLQHKKIPNLPNNSEDTGIQNGSWVI